MDGTGQPYHIYLSASTVTQRDIGKWIGNKNTTKQNKSAKNVYWSWYVLYRKSHGAVAALHNIVYIFF